MVRYEEEEDVVAEYAARLESEQERAEWQQ
jgi:hypothetical protein